MSQYHAIHYLQELNTVLKSFESFSSFSKIQKDVSSFFHSYFSSSFRFCLPSLFTRIVVLIRKAQLQASHVPRKVQQCLECSLLKKEKHVVSNHFHITSGYTYTWKIERQMTSLYVSHSSIETVTEVQCWNCLNFVFVIIVKKAKRCADNYVPCGQVSSNVVYFSASILLYFSFLSWIPQVPVKIDKLGFYLSVYQ